MKDKKGSRDPQIKSESKQCSSEDPSRRESKYANQDHRPKTSRFSNPTTTKIPSLLDLPSENPFTSNDQMPSNRSSDSFFHNDDSAIKPGPNQFPSNQSNRFGNEQSNRFADGMNFSKDSSFGYRFGDNKAYWKKHDQPNSRFNDEQSFSNQFGGSPSGRDSYGGNDSQDRFASNMGSNFATNNANRFGQDQLSNSSTNKFPTSNTSQFNRFGQDLSRSNSNSQESFALGPSPGIVSEPSKHPFSQDQDDRIMSNTTFSNRFAQQDPVKTFTNPFAQNAPVQVKNVDDARNSFPGKDVKNECDAGRHPLNDNQRFLQNQTPNHFMITTPPPPSSTNEQRNVFPNQSMNRFGPTTTNTNPDGFGRTTNRFDDFQNSFPRPAFNMPPMNQQSTNFIPSQPNLQQPPPNFPPPSNNQLPNMTSTFNSSAFGMNFTTPPPLHTIPQPLPMSLNKIPAPKELDLNAIPEPQINLGPSNFASGTG